MSRKKPESSKAPTNRTEKARLHKALKKSGHDLDKCVAECKQKEKLISKHEQTISKLNSKITKLQSDLKTLRKDNKRLKNQIDELQHEYDQVKYDKVILDHKLSDLRILPKLIQNCNKEIDSEILDIKDSISSEYV